MDEWISLDIEKPANHQHCKVLFEDGTESVGSYWAEIGIFTLTGPLTSFKPMEVTHWMPST